MAQEQIKYQGEIAQRLRSQGVSEADIAKQAETDIPILTDAARKQYWYGGTVDNVAAPTKDKTAANNFGLGTNPPVDEAAALRKKLFDESQVQSDPATLRAEFLKQVQAQIDSITQVYDQMVAKEQIAGTGRLGQQRALAARSGIQGSDFGNSQKDKVVSANEDIVNSIQAERAAKINSILMQVDDKVSARLAEERAAKQKGAAEYLDFLDKQTERKKSDASDIIDALLAQGIDPSTLDDEEVNRLGGALGLSRDDFLTIVKGKKATSDAATAAAKAEAAQKEAASAPTTVKEYQAAVTGGFKGTLLEFLAARAKATRAPGSGGSGGTGFDIPGDTTDTTDTGQDNTGPIGTEGEGYHLTSATGRDVYIPGDVKNNLQYAAAYLAQLRDDGELTDAIYNYVVAQNSNIFTRGATKARINALMGSV